MKVSKGELVMTAAELVAAPAALGLLVGPLSRLPRTRATAADAAAVTTFFADLREPMAALHRGVIATLAKPVRVGVLHHAIGEESLSRAVLAWGPDTGEDAVVMASREDDWVIRPTGRDELVSTVRSILLEDVPLSPSKLRVALSQDSALVLLAILHALRVGRLRSMLEHTVAPLAFTPGAIIAAFDEAPLDDFRWPFLFWDKVLPSSLDGQTWEGRIEPALAELAKRGLVTEAKGVTGGWMPTPLGYRLAVADAQHLTKVGLRVTGTTEEGSEAHEAFLFQRSPRDVSMIDLGGREAVIASLGFDDLGRLLDGVLKPPASAVATPPAPLGPPSTPSAARSAPRFCAACGAVIKQGAKFCGECGARIAVVP